MFGVPFLFLFFFFIFWLVVSCCWDLIFWMLGLEEKPLNYYFFFHTSVGILQMELCLHLIMKRKSKIGLSRFADPKMCEISVTGCKTVLVA